MQQESCQGERGAGEERRSIAFSRDSVLRPRGTPLAGYSDLERGARVCTLKGVGGARLDTQCTG